MLRPVPAATEYWIEVTEVDSKKTKPEKRPAEPMKAKPVEKQAMPPKAKTSSAKPAGKPTR